MSDDSTGARPRLRTNALYWVAMAVCVVMAVASFPFWLDGRTGPVVLGLPIAFTYHALYCVAAVPVLGLLFKAIWPKGDGDTDV
ncbi:MAG: hypothetical protein ACRDPT_13405 [Streptomycetales bacterium]